MIKKIEDIVKDVRICLDQNMVSESLLNEGDIDTLSIEDIIRSKIVDAVQRVESGAPTHLLEGGHNFGDSIYWTKDGSGWTLLPDDFMRLVVFEMSDWERPVYEAISTDRRSVCVAAQPLQGTAWQCAASGVRHNHKTRGQGTGVLLMQ